MTVFVINGMGIATAWNILPCYQAVDCGEFVGFIPALKREAFSSILRKKEILSSILAEKYLEYGENINFHFTQLYGVVHSECNDG